MKEIEQSSDTQMISLKEWAKHFSFDIARYALIIALQYHLSPYQFLRLHKRMIATGKEIILEMKRGKGSPFRDYYNKIKVDVE